MDRGSFKKKLFIWYSIFWVLFCVALYRSYAVYFTNTTSTISKWLGLSAGAIAILFGSCKMIDNHYYGTKAEIRKFFSSFFGAVRTSFLAVDTIIVFLSIIFIASTYKFFGFKFEVCFVLGLISAKIINLFNNRNLIKNSISESLDFKNEISFLKLFSSSTASSFISFGIAISCIASLYHYCKDDQILLGYALGYAFIYVFYVLINVICKQSVDSADVILEKARVENNDEDPEYLYFIKNAFHSITPAFYQLNDIIFTFIIILIASMCVGAACELGLMAAFYPIIVASSVIFSIVFVVSLVKLNKDTDYIKNYLAANIISGIVFLLLIYYTLKVWTSLDILITSCTLGVVASLVINIFAIRQMFYSNKTAINISNAAITGSKHAFLQTLKEAFASVQLPVIVSLIAFFGSFMVGYLAQAPLVGLFSFLLCVLTIVTFAMLNVIYSLFSQHLISLNLFNQQTFEIENAFNLIKETGSRFLFALKKYFNFISFISVIAVVIAYCVAADIEQVDILNPFVFISVLVGVWFIYYYSSSIISFVLKLTRRVMFDVKRQLRVYYYIGEDELDIANVNIIKSLTINALKLILPLILLALSVFFLITYMFLTEALAGFLISLVVVCVGIWCFCTNFAILAKLAEDYFKKEYENAKETNEYAVLKSIKDLVSGFDDFMAPSLVVLVKLLALTALSLVPILNLL